MFKPRSIDNKIMITPATTDQGKADRIFTSLRDNQGRQRSNLRLKSAGDSLHITSGSIEIVHRTIEIKVKQSLSSALPDKDTSRLSLSLKTTYTRAALPVDPTGDMDHWGAEKTSSRIADMASGLADLWKAGNPDKSKEEFRRFLDTLTGAVEKGFSEAQKILDGVISSPVQELIRDTYDKTMAKISASFDEKMRAFEGQSEG